MNTSIHIPGDLNDRLIAYLNYSKLSKNKFIVQAIEKSLNELENQDLWHPNIINWQGVPEFEAGSLDEDLLPLREDIV
jgi:hypothetical protein